MAKKKARKGVEPAGLKRYRLAKAGVKTTRRKSSGSKAAPAKKRKKSSTTTALAASVAPTTMRGAMNLGALFLGAALAWNYKDDARIVKLIKDPKYRYGALTALAVAPPLVAMLLKKKLPEPVTFLCIGAGAAGAIATVPLVFPKLLPAPQQGLGMGRLDKGKLDELRRAIDRARPGGQNGLNSKMTGLNSKMTGRKPMDVITGLPAGYGSPNFDTYSSVWT